MQQSIVNTAPDLPDNATVKFPISAQRGEPLTYVRVLDRAFLDRKAMGWRLDGPLYRPGARVARNLLPSPLIAVEAAGRSRVGRGHNRSEYLYLLWQWDEAETWHELVRASSTNWDWQWTLGPVAERLLAIAPIEERVARRVDELLATIDRTMRECEPALKPMVCAAVEERLVAGRVAA
ncbi:MAG: hypothetical protein ABFD89_29530 [Bryobacteraceae bacterium]